MNRMSRIDECPKIVVGQLKPSKEYCKNNCKNENCKYIGMRHSKVKPIDRPHNKKLKRLLEMVV